MSSQNVCWETGLCYIWLLCAAHLWWPEVNYACWGGKRQLKLRSILNSLISGSMENTMNKNHCLDHEKLKAAEGDRGVVEDRCLCRAMRLNHFFKWLLQLIATQCLTNKNKKITISLKESLTFGKHFFLPRAKWQDPHALMFVGS